MISYMKTIKVFSLSFLVVIVVACGGGGGSGTSTAGETFTGNTSPAQIDESNAQEIGETAGESVSQAASSSTLPTAVQIQDDRNTILRSVLSTVKLSILPTGVDVSDEVCLGGGTANVTVSGPGARSGSGRLQSRTVYGNCVFVSGSTSFTIDGTVFIDYDNVGNPNSGFSVVYQGVNVSGLGFGNQTLNFTFSCTNVSDINSCTQSSVFVSEGGGKHQISDFSISGNGTIGYSGNATFSHETFGSVSITVSNITYGNCGTIPDGGSISFSSTNGTSGTINFASDCTSSGTWNSGLASGSF